MALLAASCEGTGLDPMAFNDHHGNLVLDRLRYQRETGRFCDVSILVKDRQFCAHRTILASCSPYFDSIFKATKVVKEQVVVNSNSPKAFELLLNYMYSGSVVIDRSAVTELLRLANNFLVTKLKSYCAEYLDRYLDAANCLSVKALATKYNLPRLLSASSEYFDANVNRCLLESVDILQYPITQFTAVLEDPKFQDVICPDTHLKSVIRWIEVDIPARDGYFRQLILNCNFQQVPPELLEEMLDYSALLKENHRYRHFILLTMRRLGLPLEKYEQQLTTLMQQYGENPLPLKVNREPVLPPEEPMEEDPLEDDMDDCPVAGHPSSNVILSSLSQSTAENTAENSDEKPRLRLKINLGAFQERKRNKVENKLFRRAIVNSYQKKRGRPPKETQGNEILPIMDDEDIDGVYATSTLEGNVVTYTDDDMVDPEDVDEGEDNGVENGTYKCTFCRFSCMLEEDLEKHKARIHNKNTIYLCQLCDFDATWNKQFYEHCRKLHWPSAPYNCDQCAFVAPNRIQDLLCHRLTHTQDNFFKCIECGFRARTRTQLWAHERMHSCLDDRLMHCEECGRGFNSDASFQLHQSTHDDPRPYVCEDCGFASNNVDHLSVHRKQHTGDLCYCHIEGCDYVSPKKSQLAAHLRTHMAVRSHMCKMCGRGFIEKSHLVRHERIHLIDKPFKCDMCDYASSRRDKLKEHILKHHNGNSTGTKGHRRRYRRARQLAVLTAQAKLTPQDALFRPIPQNESVSEWAENQANFGQGETSQSFERSDPQTSYRNQEPQTSYQNQDPQSSYPQLEPSTSYQTNQNETTNFSPQRAFSVTHQPPQPMTALSPGSMSLMNVHLGGSDLMDKHNLSDPLASPLVTPSPGSPSDIFMESHMSNVEEISNMPPEAIHRPMSLPPYGQQQNQHHIQQGQWW
ncbi:unnamed protein product [Auanema sp. JU1783]|nr:unnamed protein product [Auanema sp. JU1783]